MFHLPIDLSPRTKILQSTRRLLYISPSFPPLHDVQTTAQTAKNLTIMPQRKLSPAESKQKKVEIAAVIDFCTAQGLNFSKTQVFRFFGIVRRTGSLWFPSSYSPIDRGISQPESAPPIVLTAREEALPVKRQNPIRNGGRDRKRLKSMIDDMKDDEESDISLPPVATPALSQTPSSPVPEPPPTPSNRKIADPNKNVGSRSGRQVKQDREVEIKSENFDDEVEV